MTAKLAKLQASLRLIDHKIGDGSGAAVGAAGQLWVLIPPASARHCVASSEIQYSAQKSAGKVSGYTIPSAISTTDPMVATATVLSGNVGAPRGPRRSRLTAASPAAGGS